MEQREKYEQFLGHVPDAPPFVQPWYLDAVCLGGRWGVSLVEEEG
ncbi:MAG: methicillin resistance protein, partial [Bacteroidetes bacterium]